MKRLPIIFLSLMIILAASLTAGAVQKEDRKEEQKERDQEMQEPLVVTGNVTFVDDKSLTIEVSTDKKKRSSQAMTFVINQDTKQPADIGIGFEATVEYKREAGANIATLITIKVPPLLPRQ